MTYQISVTPKTDTNLCLVGGNITLNDLEGYYALEQEPLRFNLENGNITLLAPLPPSGGAVVGHILKILDGKSTNVCSC